MADHGNGPEEEGEKQEGQCHERKTADFDRAGKDDRLDSGSKLLHPDTCAATGASVGEFVSAAAGRSFTIIQESVADRIRDTSFVFN